MPTVGTGRKADYCKQWRNVTIRRPPAEFFWHPIKILMPKKRSPLFFCAPLQLFDDSLELFVPQIFFRVDQTLSWPWSTLLSNRTNNALNSGEIPPLMAPPHSGSVGPFVTPLTAKYLI